VVVYRTIIVSTEHSSERGAGIQDRFDLVELQRIRGGTICVDNAAEVHNLQRVNFRVSGGMD